jgi:hypothetical protein
MATKREVSDPQRVAAFHARLDRPLRVVIADASGYWLEDADHRRLTEEQPTSDASMRQVLAEVAGGRDPANLVLVCRGVGFVRYEISRGTILVDLAEGAVGIPASVRSGAESFDRG